MVLVLNKGDSPKQIEKINKRLKEFKIQKSLDAKKFCGKIKLKESPLNIQNKLRNEWE